MRNRPGKSLLRILSALGLGLLLVQCAENPVTGRQQFVMMSEPDELRVGREGDAEVRKEYQTYPAPDLQKYVDQIGQRLARNSHRAGLAYRFTVLDSPEVNAFALPGGYVYITRGIMAYLNSEAELAAVLGHELGHITARHGVQQYTAAQAANIGVAIGSIFLPELASGAGQSIVNLLGNALLSGYGREHELEADRLGAEYLSRAGYDSQAMIRVIGVLKNQELFDAEVARQEGREPRAYHGLFASHPDNDTRLQQVVAEAGRLGGRGGTDSPAALLAQLDGLVFGDSPSQGLIRNNTFLHPELGFAARFPQNWRIRNLADRLVASAPDESAGVELRVQEAKGAPADTLRRVFRLGGGVPIQNQSVGGLPAATSTLSMQGRPVRVAAIHLENKAFLMLGSAASPAAFQQRLADINGIIQGFHPITAAERAQARPYTLRLTKAQPNATYASLARESPLGRHAEGYLRLLNAAYPRGEPAAGQSLKIVR